VSDPNNAPNNVHYLPPSSGPGLKIPILFGVVIALVAANVYLFLQLDQVRTEVGALRESLLNEISNLRESSTVSSQTHQRRLEAMREELEAARRQAAMAAGQAKLEATKRAEELARQLEVEQARQKAEQEKARQELSQSLSEVAKATDATKAGLSEVKTEVSATKSELEKTISALKQVTGDLGVQSGLIATNAKELAALKALGDRDYFEFDIKKTKQPVRVGDIALKLKKTDEKKGRFTIDVVADDRVVEKKDRTVNEPLQFYVSAARQPYELVINQVQKDRIVGYLATPKVKQPRAQTAKASS
jgi:ABC-type transporter MlaC component